MSYLLVANFFIKTDHKTLAWPAVAGDPGESLAQGTHRFQAFDFSMQQLRH